MNEMRYRKGKGCGLAALALALSFLGTGLSGGICQAAETDTAGQQLALGGEMSLEAEYGYDGNAKKGRFAPMTIRMENHGREDFQGNLHISTMEADYTIYSYEYPVVVEADAGLEKEICIPMGMGSDQVYVSLVDENGKKINQKRVKIENSQDTAEVFVGLLSDQPAELDYLNGVGISYGALKTRAFSIATEDFPYDSLGLDMLDVLVVNDYRLRDLSEDQTRAIMEWVEAGGVMILGTGERVDDTLGRFAPELLDDSYDNPVKRKICPSGDGEESSEMAKIEVEVPCVRVLLHGGTVLMSDFGYPLVSAASRGKGTVAVTAYDLGDIREYGLNDVGFVDRLFSEILGEEKLSELSSYIYGSTGEEYWAVQSAINTGNVEKLPDVKLYLVVIVFYIVLVGPGLYLFLKKKGMRSHYGICVTVLSVLFAMIIYMMGIKTRFRDTFLTYATVEDITSDVVTETSYVNARNPYSRPYTVRLDSAYSVLPVTRNNYYYYEQNTVKFTGEEESQTSVFYGSDGTDVTVRDASAFDSRYFKLTRQEENSNGVGISGSIRYLDGKVSGTLTNDFSFGLENVAVLLYGRLVIVGDMEAGETVDLAERESLSAPVGNAGSVASRITGLADYEKADINNKQYMQTLERNNLLSFYIQNNLQGYRAEAQVIAFGSGEEKNQRFRETGFESYGLTMLTSSLEVNSSEGRTRYRSGLLRRASVVQGGYDPIGNQAYTQDPVTLEYYLGSDLEISKVEFCGIGSSFEPKGNTGGPSAFTGSIYLYNRSTGTFDQIEDGKFVFKKEELKPYLSEDNVLTVKYVSTNSDSYGWAVLPMPMVTGREI